MISEMIASDSAFEVVGTARDGEDGVEKALSLKPDLITLDIEMPRKDGLSALREIKALCHDFKPAVLMCSSLTVDGSTEAFKAMRIGASDVIGKDPATVGKNDAGFKQELLAKLHAIGGHRTVIQQTTHRPSARISKTKNQSIQEHVNEKEIDFSRVKAVVVGSSTGGPPVLEEIFSKLPSNLRVPIIVAQHMPELFTKSLSNRLDQLCKCKVKLAAHGTIISDPGIYIAQGGNHLKPTSAAGGKVIAKLSEEIQGVIYRPSVDLLFSAASEIYGENLLAIQLTGMGADGAKGAASIQKTGGQIIAQSASTCVVYGMPKAVIENKLADLVLSPTQIRDLITNLGGLSIPSRISA